MFLSLIAYPILILLTGLGIGVFLLAINTNNQAKITYNLMQAQYYAYQGIEDAYVEVKNQAFDSTPFLTHDVVSVTNALAQRDSFPEVKITGCLINTTGAYEYKDVSGNGFEAKVYELHNEIYILSKGISSNISRLFITKLAGTSLYNYFAFYPGNISLGWQTMDAQGGKIHSNGDLIFLANLKMLNISELSSYGKMAMGYYPAVKPGEESAWYTRRWPYVRPNNYPDPYNPDDYPEQYPLSPPNYTNYYDGYISGDNVGLLMEDPAYNDGKHFTAWDATPDNINGTNPAIMPGDYSTYGFIYQQSNDCKATNTCASGATHNENYYYAMPRINEIAIDNRIGGETAVQQYLGDTETIPVIMTDSSKDTDTSQPWLDYLKQFDSTTNEEDGTLKITGLYDSSNGPLVKAGSDFILPPSINLSKLTTEADVTIEKNADGTVKMTINGEEFLEDADGIQYPAESGNIIARRQDFYHNLSGKLTEALELDLGAMVTAGAAPANGIIYAKYPNLVIANAKQLPSGGLTTVLDGNIYLKGDYNYDTDSDFSWQPSAVIASGESYFLSDEFDYPRYDEIPVTQYYPEYPEGGSFEEHTFASGTGWTKNIAEDGYNWFAEKSAEMANKVTQKEYHYVLSLVGPKAYDPQVIERWIYPKDDDDLTQGSDDHHALFTGAAVQLDAATFPFSWGNLYRNNRNYRQCDQNIYPPDDQLILSLDYPCRATGATGTPDFFGTSANEARYYEKNYLASPLRPPGDLMGLTQSITLELSSDNDHFNRHYWEYFGT